MARAYLRLFSPDGELDVTASSSLIRFFDRWVVPSANSDRRRRPISPATLQRRRAAVLWWGRLMSTAEHPEGPPLGDITEELLAEFADRLKTATYRRGPFSARRIPLSPVTQIRTLEEVQIVLGTAGPASGRRVRAGLLADPPAIYVPPIETVPKPTWTTDEAMAIAKGIESTEPPRGWRLSVNAYATLARATLALWFYTGHRATTWAALCWDHLAQHEDGWRLRIQSVKTRKIDTIAVHPRLLAALQACEGLDPRLIVPWPISVSAIAAAHLRWQHQLPGTRRFSPQAWRRCHARHIAQTGFQFARELAAGALGHSSASITDAHYTSARDAAVLMLPDLFADS